MNSLTLMLQSFERITNQRIRASGSFCASKKGPSTRKLRLPSPAIGPDKFLCLAKRRHSHFWNTSRKQIPVAAT